MTDDIDHYKNEYEKNSEDECEKIAKCQQHSQIGIDICEQCWEDAKNIGRAEARKKWEEKYMENTKLYRENREKIIESRNVEVLNAIDKWVGGCDGTVICDGCGERKYVKELKQRLGLE